MTVENFDTILRRLDPTMSSCLFRYGGAEKYMLRGYTPQELKEIGDWESSRMPEIYAERKAITPLRFASGEKTQNDEESFWWLISCLKICLVDSNWPSNFTLQQKL